MSLACQRCWPPCRACPNADPRLLVPPPEPDPEPAETPPTPPVPPRPVPRPLPFVDRPARVEGARVQIEIGVELGASIRPDLSPSDNKAEPWDAPYQPRAVATAKIVVIVEGTPLAPPDSGRQAWISAVDKHWTRLVEAEVAALQVNLNNRMAGLVFPLEDGP